MTTPEELLKIARRIDPELKQPEITLVEALLVARALELAMADSFAFPEVRIMTEAESPSQPIPGPVQPVRIESAERLVKRRGPELPDQVVQLRDHLKKTGISKRSLATALGINTANLYGWLAGKWKPSPEYQAKIQAYLGQFEA
jgi:DNA-binding transcriptional regulator YiaG